MKRFSILVAILAACSAPPAPAPAPQPRVEAPAAERSIGTVRVTATTLNVRREASPTADVIGQVRQGERVTLLSATDEWDRIRLGDGTIGFVSAQHVMREGVRARRGCAPDADYQFVKAPVPAFPEHAPHGMVTVDADVNARGEVTSTRVIANTTGDESLGALASREIRSAKFSPPIRNCMAKAFIFTYKRSF